MLGRILQIQRFRSGSLTLEFKNDITAETLFGRGSGESIQRLFRGDGFVVVQPYEDPYLQRERRRY